MINVPEGILTANWIKQKLHVFELMRWKDGFGGEVLANQEFVLDLHLFRCEAVPRDDLSREKSADRVGSGAFCSQEGVGFYPNSKIERMAGQEELLKGLQL